MRKYSSAIAAALLVSTATPAIAQNANSNVSELVVFGDSLVDAGNTNTIFPVAANPANGYFDGRFTNGYNYPDLLSIDLFGAPTVASLDGGTNFAYGGARITSTTFIIPDLQEQIALFQGFLANGGSVDDDALFILNFGGNDVFYAAQDGVPAGYASDSAYLSDAAAIYAQAVLTLEGLGASNFLVTGIPNPVPLGFEAENYLLAELAGLDLNDDTVLNFFSYQDFFARLANDPTQFGLPADLNFDTNCQAAGAVPDCSGYFSFDGTHPTAAVQRAAYLEIQRQFGFSAAVPEPSTWGLLLLGFFAVAAAMRRRRAAQIRSVQVSFG